MTDNIVAKIDLTNDIVARPKRAISTPRSITNPRKRKWSDNDGPIQPTKRAKVCLIDAL